MLIGILSGLAAGALWGFIVLASKILTDYSAVDIALGRFLVCGLVSVTVLAPRYQYLRRVLTWKLAAQALGLACLSYSFYFVVLVQSIKFVGMVPAILIVDLLPITIALYARDKVTHRGLFSVSLILIAVGFMLLNGGLILGLTTDVVPAHWLKGIACAGLALGMWTFFAPLNARILAQNPGINSTMWSSLLGVAALISILPLWLCFSSALIVPEHLLATRFVLWMALTGFGSSWLAGILWNIASRRLPSALAGQLIVSETIFALIYGYIYDWKLPLWNEALAAVLMIAGVLIGIRCFRKPVVRIEA
jgi:drug/metabolite transporter (DMT)-like permease